MPSDDDIPRMEEDKLGSEFYDKHVRSILYSFYFYLYVGNRTLRGRYIFLVAMRAPNATTTEHDFSHQPRERRSPYRPRPCSRPPLAQSGKAGRQAPAERNRQGDGRHHADHARALWQKHIRASYALPLPPPPPFATASDLFSLARKTLTNSFSFPLFVARL